MISNLFKPRKLLSLINSIKPYLLFLTFVLLFAGLYFALINSPEDYQQGGYVRIMYVHVPSAWLSLAIYSFMAIMSFCHLVFGSKMANIFCRETAPIGLSFTLIALITGSLWGKPTWGTWWAWDARLTFMLILFFFYLSYIILSRALYNNFDSKAPSTLAILGFINVPIIKFSVDIWNSLHQTTSVFRLDGPTIDIAMLWPLILMFLFSLVISLLIFLIRVERVLLENLRD